MKVTDIAEDIAELATRIANQLPERLYAMRTEMAGQPRAARYDSGGVSHQWCWTHERDVDQCHRDDLDCTGETFVLHDPTGEAAVGYDKAQIDRDNLERHLCTAHRVLDRVVDILVCYAPARPDIPRAGVGTCCDCHRYFDGRNGKLSVYKGTDPVCTACRARRDRAANEPAPCTHPRTKWHEGVTSCDVCGAQLAVA